MARIRNKSDIVKRATKSGSTEVESIAKDKVKKRRQKASKGVNGVVSKADKARDSMRKPKTKTKTTTKTKVGGSTKARKDRRSTKVTTKPKTTAPKTTAANRSQGPTPAGRTYKKGTDDKKAARKNAPRSRKVKSPDTIRNEQAAKSKAPKAAPKSVTKAKAKASSNQRKDTAFQKLIRGKFGAARKADLARRKKYNLK